VEGPAKSIKLAFGSPQRDVPIFLAGSGERAHRTAGRVADGALISGMPNELVASIESVRTGEREARRPAGSTRILLWTTVAVDDDREAARAAVRGSVARRALNTLGRLARQGQLDAQETEAIEKLQAAHNAGHHSDAEYAVLVPERWVDRFSIAGTPAEVRARLEKAVQQGAQEISMILMGPRSGDRGAADQLTHFAEAVMHPMRDVVKATA
jgi:alkanesulfonate monooxygenase SsuD/methylene tetrahydromethanopterin reductase-like flavin-dependent oxidoreductase (luciferase family)